MIPAIQHSFFSGTVPSAIPRIAWLVPVATAWLMCLGCGSGGELLHEVRGAVRYGQAPLMTGVVSLRADVGNKTLHQPTGVIDNAGNYRIFTNGEPGAPPGNYRVVIFATEPTIDTGLAHPSLPKSLIPKKYNHANSSPLAVQVKADAPAGSYDLTLEQGKSR